MRIALAREHPDYVGVKVDGTDEVQSGIRQRAVDSYISATDGVPVSRELLDQSIDRLRILTTPFLITLRGLVVRGRFRRFRHRSSGHAGRRTGNRQTGQRGHAEFHSSLRVSGRPGDSRWIPIPGALDEGRQAEQAYQDFRVNGRDLQRVEDSDAGSRRSVCACWTHGQYR